jgi:hypothetical protein
MIEVNGPGFTFAIGIEAGAGKREAIVRNA